MPSPAKLDQGKREHEAHERRKANWPPATKERRENECKGAGAQDEQCAAPQHEGEEKVLGWRRKLAARLETKRI